MHFNDYFYFLGKRIELTHTVETRFVDILESHTDVPIWPVYVPGVEAATFPAITYRRASGGREDAYTNKGQGFLIKPRFQLDIWAYSSDEANEIANDLQNNLNGALSIDFPGCKCLDRVEESIEPVDGSDEWIHHIQLDVQLIARETPTNPRFSKEMEGGDLYAAIHTYLTEQGVEHAEMNSDVDDVEPWVTFDIPYTEQNQNLNKAIGIRNQLITFNLHGTSYDEVKDLHEQLRLMFSGFRGSVGGCLILGVKNDNEADFYIPPIDGSQEGFFHIVSDWNFVYKA